MSGQRISAEEFQTLLERGCIPDEIHAELREQRKPYMTLMVRCPELLEPVMYWAAGEDVVKIRELMRQPRDQFKS